MLDKAIPIYQENNIVFSRQEEDSYLTVLLKEYPGGLKLLNATSREILDLCDGSNTVAQIHTILKKRYPKEKPHNLLRDLKQSLMIMSGESLVKWEGNKNPFLPNQSIFEIRIDPITRVYRANENDFNDIMAIAHEATAHDHNRDGSGLIVVIASPITKAGIYNALMMRARMFNFTERVYFLEYQDVKIGMLCILDDFPMSRRGIISLLILKNKEKACENIQNLFSGGLSDLKKHHNKIKCNLFSDQPEIDTYDACLREIGFVREGLYKNEYTNGIDEWIYGKEI